MNWLGFAATWSPAACRAGRLPVRFSVSSWLPQLACVAALGVVLGACAPAPLAPPPSEPPPRQTAPTPPPQPAPQYEAAPAEPTIREPYESVEPAPELTPPEDNRLLTRPGDLGGAPVRVALLVPLSGPSKNIGMALLDAAQLALFDVGDEFLTLMPRDTGGTPDGAALAATQAISEGAELILGPLFAGSVRTVAPIARERQVNIVAFSTDRSVAGEGVYLMGFTPDEQVERVVAYAIRQGLRRFAALAPETPYGRTVVAALERTALRLGGNVVRVETYGPTDEDVTEPVKRLARYDARRGALIGQRKALEGRNDQISRNALARLSRLDTLGDPGYDAVMLPEGGARLRAVAPLLPFYDIDTTKIRLLGTGLWDEPNIGAEPALQGGWFAGPPPLNARALAQRFEAVYGRKPPRIVSLAYDATALAALLARDTTADRFSRTALTADSGFAGFGGIFRFRPGGVAERGLAIIQIEPDSLQVVEPAPESFDELVN